VDDTTAARIGKRVGARYAVTGTFTDFYGDFRVDLHLVNVETGEIITVEKEHMRRDHLFDIGERDKAIEMYSRALEAFPQYGEASEGLQRLKTS
jgi:TolB-like protein